MTEHPLIGFLRARWAEEEQIARAAAAEAGGTDWHGNEYGLFNEDTSRHPGPFLSDAYGYLHEALVAHFTRHDPAYVLADVDSKRRILVRCQEEMLSGIPRLVHFAQQTLRELAMPYAGRDDYPEELP